MMNCWDKLSCYEISGPAKRDPRTVKSSLVWGIHGVLGEMELVKSVDCAVSN